MIRYLHEEKAVDSNWFNNFYGFTIKIPKFALLFTITDLKRVYFY